MEERRKEKAKYNPEIFEDSKLYYKTRNEMAHMGLKPPTWIEWIREYSFLGIDDNKPPDPLDDVEFPWV